MHYFAAYSNDIVQLITQKALGIFANWRFAHTPPGESVLFERLQ